MTDRVLLIDDDPNVLTALSRTLHKHLTIATANSGDQAVTMVADALAAKSRFAVAVCDMHMPGMDGMETLKRLRALDAQLVGIMLTGDADQSTAIDALNSGNIFRFYSKPFDCDLLIAGIASGIRQNHLLQAERQLAENEERWRLALEAVGDGVWDWDTLTETAYFSRDWWRMLNVHDRAGAAPIDEWLCRVHPDDAGDLRTRIENVRSGTETMLNFEHRLRCDDGTYRWFLVRGVVLFRAENGRALRTIGTHTDITRRREMEDLLRRQTEELTILATTDPLTGLLNRRCFLEKADAELLRSFRYERDMAMIMVDIDFFKKVNDTYGHAVGDTVLRRVADLLGANMRSSDSLGRLGGEEFAVLLPETSTANAQILAETLRKKLAEDETILSGGAKLKITASFGVAALASAGDTVKSILDHADEALYAAKQAGRNLVVCRP